MYPDHHQKLLFFLILVQFLVREICCRVVGVFWKTLWGMAYNLAFWCILTIFRIDLSLVMVWLFPFLALFWLRETSQTCGFQAFSGEYREGIATIRTWLCLRHWIQIMFLAATKQLYEWFSRSVGLSVCDAFFIMFPSSYHHEILGSYYQLQKWCPCKRSRSEVKGQGHRGQNPT